MSFLDKLTNKFTVKNNEAKEYYFGLNIGLTEITAVVWGLFNHKVEVFGQSTLGYQGTDELMINANLALDKSLGAIEVEPTKILFGVPESWIIDEELKEPYLKLLQKMVKEYDIQPMAYVSHVHAIAHLLQKQDGIPPTALIIGVGDYIEASLLKGGKMIESRMIKRQEQLFSDMEKMLVSFIESEVLPSKIVLYGTKVGEDLDKIRDELLDFPWMQKLPFLHFPKIEILGSDLTTLATLLAGATEIDPDLNFKHTITSLGLRPKELVKPLTSEHLGTHRLSRISSQDMTEKEEEELGFVAGDIKQEQPVEDKEQDDLEGPVETEKHQEFNEYAFPVNKGDLTQYQGRSDLYKPISFLSNLSNFKLPPIKIQKWLGLVKSPLGVIPLILALLLTAYVLFVKADVTIFVEPRVLEKTTEIVADPTIKSIDEEKKIIPSSILETTVAGTGRLAATGTKQIGDPAKGRVLVYNKTDTSKTFFQGTVLVGQNNLKFTLDSSVTVASQSATQVADGVTYTFGKASSSVTAAAIGPDSNLSAGTELSVAQLPASSYVAKVDQALSGGTSKIVTVVTSDDQKKLQASVLDELKVKAAEDLKSKLTGDKKIIPEALAVIDGKYNFNKQINDQAGEFSLNATVHFKGAAYSDADLRTVVAKLVGVDVPEGYQMDLAATETQADVLKVDKDGKLTFTARFRAKLLPKLDTDQLKNALKGKTVSGAIDKLKELENVAGAEIKFIPNIPTKIALMPFLSRNIFVNVIPR